MMLTAIEMDKVEAPFAAVHDSYWVHAGNVDAMNDQLRQVRRSARFVLLEWSPRPLGHALAIGDYGGSAWVLPVPCLADENTPPPYTSHPKPIALTHLGCIL